jgi:hypothetical protein
MLHFRLLLLLPLLPLLLLPLLPLLLLPLLPLLLPPPLFHIVLLADSATRLLHKD